ncbi:MAG TPA: hypothetical protein VF244_10255, partial [Acidimicrobiales bacterium]
MKTQHGNGGPRVRWTIIGVVAAVIGFPLSGILGIISILSMNPCGMMGDACDDYGQVNPDANVLFG